MKKEGVILNRTFFFVSLLRAYENIFGIFNDICMEQESQNDGIFGVMGFCQNLIERIYHYCRFCQVSLILRAFYFHLRAYCELMKKTRFL